jgi:hypothetical protein
MPPGILTNNVSSLVPKNGHVVSFTSGPEVPFKTDGAIASPADIPNGSSTLNVSEIQQENFSETRAYSFIWKMDTDSNSLPPQLTPTPHFPKLTPTSPPPIAPRV